MRHEALLVSIALTALVHHLLAVRIAADKLAKIHAPVEDLLYVTGPENGYSPSDGFFRYPSVYTSPSLRLFSSAAKLGAIF